MKWTLCCCFGFWFLIHRRPVSTGQSQVICSPQPIVALAGDDVTLPCHLEPATSNFSGTVEWTRPDLDPEYIHVHQSGRLVLAGQNPQYKYRTVLFVDELKNGNVSLKLFSVTISDEGTYRLFIPSMWKEAFIQLHVGSVSSPVIEITKSSSGVVLECECKGWYPEPELFWLDGEGNILSAGPPETVRGPDGLYTVSSRVTVEKTDTNSFTCRAQQLSINQTRDTQVQVPDYCFPAVSISIASAVLFLCVVAVFFVVCKWRRNKIRNKKHHEDESKQKGENRKHSLSNNIEVQFLMEGERNQERETMKDLDEGGEKNFKSLSNEAEAQDNREEERKSVSEDTEIQVVTGGERDGEKLTAGQEVKNLNELKAKFKEELKKTENDQKYFEGEFDKLMRQKRELEKNIQKIKLHAEETERQRLKYEDKLQSASRKVKERERDSKKQKDAAKKEKEEGKKRLLQEAKRDLDKRKAMVEGRRQYYQKELENTEDELARTAEMKKKVEEQKERIKVQLKEFED